MKSERGEIGSTFIVVIAIFAAVVIMVLTPLLTMADRSSDISQTVAQAVVTEIGNKCAQKGSITQQDLDELQESLPTDVLWDINMEVLVKDQNLAIKVHQAEKNKLGENPYFAVYFTDIKKAIDETGSFKMEDGYVITITAKNKTQTPMEQLSGGIDQGNSSYVAEYTAMVTGQGN